MSAADGLRVTNLGEPGLSVGERGVGCPWRHVREFAVVAGIGAEVAHSRANSAQAIGLTRVRRSPAGWRPRCAPAAKGGHAAADAGPWAGTRRAVRLVRTLLARFLAGAARGNLVGLHVSGICCASGSPTAPTSSARRASTQRHERHSAHASAALSWSLAAPRRSAVAQRGRPHGQRRQRVHGAATGRLEPARRETHDTTLTTPTPAPPARSPPMDAARTPAAVAGGWRRGGRCWASHRP